MNECSMISLMINIQILLKITYPYFLHDLFGVHMIGTYMIYRGNKKVMHHACTLCNILPMKSASLAMGILHTHLIC